MPKYTIKKSKQTGTEELRHIDTWALRQFGTWTLGHLCTKALEYFDSQAQILST